MTCTFKSNILAGIFLLVIPVLLNSCAKEPGPGGKSTLYGRVWVKDYNSTFTVLLDEYYGPDIWVYIVYGDDRDYSDRVKTSYDGTYEFRYMRPGSYHLYTYSKDSTLQTTADVAVIRDVEIENNKKQDIEIPLMVIFK